MLIVSDFHDYYDRAAVYGVDKTVVYERKTKSIPAKREKHVWNHTFRTIHLSDDVEFAVHEHIVGYCGHLYPLLCVTPLKPTASDVPIVQAYTADEFACWASPICPERCTYTYGVRLLRREYREEYFNRDYSRLLDLFTQHRAPLWLYTLRNEYWEFRRAGLVGDLTLHPSLRELDFQRHKDAPTAFQDIFMYLSGVLGAPDKPTIQLTNEMIQAKHGLDGKYSFKKPPGKKTRWR
jgi:hypothetical protein